MKNFDLFSQWVIFIKNPCKGCRCKISYKKTDRKYYEYYECTDRCYELTKEYLLRIDRRVLRVDKRVLQVDNRLLRVEK